jgi:hypothetical protein
VLQFLGRVWVNVNTPLTAKSDFAAIAKALGHVVQELRGSLQVLANLKESWLLILDNADHVEFDYQDYIPSGNHGTILMTSRLAEFKLYSPDSSEALEGLEDKNAKVLLLQASGIPHELWQSNDNAAQEIVNLLGSHTLALIQAGAYVSNGCCSLIEYPTVYQGQRKRLLSYPPSQARSRYQNVYATSEASAEMLEQSAGDAGNDALALITILSMLNSAVLSLHLFESAWRGARQASDVPGGEIPGMYDMRPDHVSLLPDFLLTERTDWDEFRLHEAVSKLVSLSLVTRQHVNGHRGISMHPVAHAWAKDRQSTDQQSESWLMTGCVVAFSWIGDYDFWRTQARYLAPHLNSCLEIDAIEAFSFQGKSIVIPILIQCGLVLGRMEDYERLRYLNQNMFCQLGLNSARPTKEARDLYELQGVCLVGLGKINEAINFIRAVGQP